MNYCIVLTCKLLSKPDLRSFGKCKDQNQCIRLVLSNAISDYFSVIQFYMIDVLKNCNNDVGGAIAQQIKPYPVVHTKRIVRIDSHD